MLAGPHSEPFQGVVDGSHCGVAGASPLQAASPAVQPDDVPPDDAPPIGEPPDVVPAPDQPPDVVPPLHHELSGGVPPVPDVEPPLPLSPELPAPLAPVPPAELPPLDSSLPHARTSAASSIERENGTAYSSRASRQIEKRVLLSRTEEAVPPPQAAAVTIRLERWIRTSRPRDVAIRGPPHITTNLARRTYSCVPGVPAMVHTLSRRTAAAGRRRASVRHLVPG